MRPIITAGLLALVTTPARAQHAPDRFHVDTLGTGVYAIVRHDPIAFANNANSLVVIGDSGVLVVDAQFTRVATNQTVGAIRRLTSKPVRYVVNTHWHDDHVAGNQVYRDSFPNVLFVSHENTRVDLATLGAENRKGTITAGGAFVARIKRLMAMGLGGDSTPLSANERAAMSSVVDIMDDYIAEAPAFRETLADITFHDRLTIQLGGKRTVDVRWFGPANTRGDAVVWVPDQRVVATGDLVVHPVPFAFNAFVSGWISALDSVQALNAAVTLPGHGPVMRDQRYVQHVSRMLRTIRDETAQQVARGAPLDSVRKSVTLASDRAAVTGGEKWLNVMFGGFFLGPSVGRAYAEATARGATERGATDSAATAKVRHPRGYKGR